MAEAEALQRAIRGRLKVCSHSLLFDPQDLRYPLLKFPFKSIAKVSTFSPGLTSRIQGELLELSATTFIAMKEDNLIKPYTINKLAKAAVFRFQPNYNPLSAILEKVSRLHVSWGRCVADRVKLIADIAKDHQLRQEFNSSWLEDLSEKVIVRFSATRIFPLVSNPGLVVLTGKRVYFMPYNNVDSEPVKKFDLTAFSRLVKRRHLLRNVGLECLLGDNSRGFFLCFESTTARDTFHDTLLDQPELHLQPSDQGNMMLLWQNGTTSNFDYLMYLNSMADRSFTDLTQYPVFPWVLADYTSTNLDLTKPSTFRDLTKPIGALTADRLAQFQRRYQDMPPPKFLLGYGTHYSSPGYVLYYTVRAAPEYMLSLQAGKYDQPDRMFRSVADTWASVQKDAADVKELVPEFYMPGGQFLLNTQALDLGVLQSGAKLGDVTLPPWAASASDFTAKCRQALECPLVSAQLHHWIDLVFGFKQRGPEAVKANNVFYFLTYEGAVDIDKITDPAEREGIEAQIMEFGQTPKQLFTIPHPARRVVGLNASEAVGASLADAVESGAVFAGPTFAASVRAPALQSSLPPAPAASVVVSVASGKFFDLKLVYTNKIHRDAVTCVRFGAIGYDTIFTVSQDTSLKMFGVADQQQLHSVCLCDLTLSCCLPLPDGKTVLAGSWDNSVYVYSVDFGRTIETLAAHDDAISGLALFEDTFISSSWDSTIKVWRTSDFVGGSRRRAPEPLAELAGHDGEVTCIVVHAGARLLASGGQGLLLVWALGDYSRVATFETHCEKVHDIAFSPDGRRVVSCGSDSLLKVFDIQLSVELMSISLGCEIFCVAFDGQLVLAGGDLGNVIVWDIVSNKKVKEISCHKGAVKSLCISSDGNRVVTGGEDRSIAFLEVNSD